VRLSRVRLLHRDRDPSQRGQSRAGRGGPRRGGDDGPLEETVTTEPRVQVLPNVEEIARAGAEAFVACASQGTPEAPCRILLSGGTTPEPMYRFLATEPTRSRLDWNSVECYFGDERPVGPDDPDSNYGMVKRVLLEPLGLAAPRVYR